MKTIKHAAIRLKSGEIIKGKSHALCYEKVIESEGFIDSDGEFCTGAVAADIGKEAGQLPIIDYEGDPLNFALSREFWDKEYGGEHEYDEEKGYYKSVGLTWHT